MPVETRTCVGRHYARPVVQHHARLPLVRFETPFERRRRHRQAVLHILIIFVGAGLMLGVAGHIWKDILPW